MYVHVMISRESASGLTKLETVQHFQLINGKCTKVDKWAEIISDS